MKCEIISNFCGKINDILIYDEEVYSSLKYIIECIENEFGEVYNDEFIKALKSELENIKDEEIERVELEVVTEDLADCVARTDKFENIKFEYYQQIYDYTKELEEFNEKLEKGEFNK